MTPYYQDEFITIYNADCRDVLPEILDIDTVITDPPYGLKFMGKDWDHGVPGVHFWELILNACKPGAFCFAFGGTRTHHRLMTAIEDAGWGLRDCLMWVYGCVDEKTEIFTIYGWKNYKDLDIENDLILSYDIEKNEFQFEKSKKKYVYQNKHSAFRIQSNNTDQIVSRNHRCIVECKGKLLFQTAEQLSQKQKICVPFLESLQELPQHISDIYQGECKKKQNLLKKVSEKITIKNCNTKRIKREKYQLFDRNNVCCLRENNEKKKKSNTKNKRTNVFKKMQWSKSRKRLETLCSSWSKKLGKKIKIGICKENDGRYKPILEGRSYLFQEEGRLRKIQNKICEVSKRIFGYGTKRWLCYGTPFNCSPTYWKVINEKRSCSSQGSQSRKQRHKQFDVISQQQQTQKIRSTYATIEEIEYHGIMWCVNVPSSAFIARRNGKIFITGNSGFPKSHAIGKAIDKKQGNEREVEEREPFGREGRKTSGKAKFGAEGWDTKPTMQYTKGNSGWDGWGTALKPSYEPIILSMKPLDGTFAENALKHGVAGLNIDGGRVGQREMNESGWSKTGSVGSVNRAMSGKNYSRPPKDEVGLGRWPANLIHDGSDEVVKGFPETTSGSGNKNTSNRSGFNGGLGMGNGNGVGADSGTAARFFYCAKAAPGERDAGLDGMEKNHHPTVKPIKLIRYLALLSKTPSGGIILDPFMGSGTTLIASKLVGRKAVGIEINEEYCEIATKRIQAYREETEVIIKDDSPFF